MKIHLIAPDYDGLVHRRRSAHPPYSIASSAFRSGRSPAQDRVPPWRSADALHAADFDLIHIQTPFAAHYLGVKLARELGIPRVETYHTYFEEYLYHYLPFLPKASTRYLARSLSRRQCNDLDALVVPSRGMLEVLRGYGIQTRAEIIPTGLPAENFMPRRWRGVPRQTWHSAAASGDALRGAGGIREEHRLPAQSRRHASRQDMPDVLLLVAGEGPALEPAQIARRSSSDSADNVLFVGYLDRKSELPDCYRAANVFVFSSCTETQGLVLLEAMAQATPVVALAEMGTRDVLQRRAGALIAAHEVEDFAAKTMSLLQRADAARQLGIRGRNMP